MGYHTVISYHNGTDVEDMAFDVELDVVEHGDLYVFFSEKNPDRKFIVAKSRFISMIHENQK